MPQLDPRTVAAAPRIYTHAQSAFQDLVTRVRGSGPPPDTPQAVAALAAGIFAGSVDASPERLVRAVELMSQVISYAAHEAAFPEGGFYGA